MMSQYQHHWQLIIIVVSLFVMFLTGVVRARQVNPKLERLRNNTPSQVAGAPIVYYTAHNRGNIQLAIANNGTFGTLGSTILDPWTGEVIPSCIYPKNSDIVYLWVAAIWIGAVVGRDTLVSVGNEDFYRTTEFYPDEEPYWPEARADQQKDGFLYRSIDINSRFFDPKALSEEDIYCEYTDTLDDPAIVLSDNTDNRSHIPLGIKVYQRSMAWSFSYADDFILFDYQVENIGAKELHDVYMGIYLDGDVWHISRNSPEGWNDDIVGFYPTHPAPEGCDFIDTINIAYHADNDGDPEGGSWNEKSALGAVGVRVVRTPAEKLSYSYNWWIINYGDPTGDFGPRKIGTDDDPYRNFGPRMGTPLGDLNKYYMLRHEEFDYDLLFTAIDHSREGWMSPPENAKEYAEGYDSRYMLSFGPFDINPGQKLPISFAWVGGTDLHQHPNDFADLFNANNPEVYYNSLDFSSLATNSRWASWVYDNPGVDTDNDGYAGKFRICVHESTLIDSNGTGNDSTWQITVADTFWYEGDNVPDFRGAGPPPAPRMGLIPGEGHLVVRWNGYYSENTPDVFLGKVDFEGYRVYIGRDDRPGSLSMVASFDRENYNRFVFRESGEQSEWVLEEIPFSIDSLQTIFDNPDFDPMLYSRSQPFSFESEVYYFEPQDYNAYDLSSTTGIHKVYPQAPHPGYDRELWNPDDLTTEHGESLPLYYEYEFVIENLLPTVPYYVAVTAFDFGSPLSGLPSLETDPTNNTVVDYPQLRADSVALNSLDVYVYPNPYRIDASYRERGFEGRSDLDRPDNRVRAIHFANLPAICKISIYSLDGDLLKVIEHDVDPGNPQSSHDSWDLITRNTQEVVSGLYYFVVESDERTQIGKLAIIN